MKSHTHTHESAVACLIKFGRMLRRSAYSLLSVVRCNARKYERNGLRSLIHVKLLKPRFDSREVQGSSLARVDIASADDSWKTMLGGG